ncbi:MAG: substrate-binding domain-containing protein, partial [Fimbriimonadaceae bacterium]|nr:substrate-binding domain-containing protein [Fimbriimonadaceae bacterium]
SAIKDAKKEGKIAIVGFDEEADTLAGIKDGTVFSTIVQQPYEFGFQSVKLMAKVLEGDKTIIPTEKKIIVPTKVINKESVEEFSKKLKELLGK